MKQQKKETLDLDEQIQSLAGDIYVEIEDKVSSFVASYIKNKELSNEDIEQHKHYQLLKSLHEQLQTTFNNAREHAIEQQTKLKKNIDSLNKKHIESDRELKGLEQLNTAKLTDSEQGLKDKLRELSSVSEQLIKSVGSEKSLKIAVVKAKEESIQLTQKVESFEKSEVNLAKNDKAKSATIDVQNQQISALTLQLNNAVSELDYIKAEHDQSSILTSQQQTQEKQQLEELQQAKEHLKDQITKLDDQLKSVNHTYSLEINNEKQLYVSLQEKHEVDIVQLKAMNTEYQGELERTVLLTKETQQRSASFEKIVDEKNIEIKGLKEKCITDKDLFDLNLAQAHKQKSSLKNALADKALFIDESNKKYKNDTDELQQVIKIHQQKISKQDEKLIFSIKQLDLLQQKKDDILAESEKTQNLIVNLEKENLVLKEKADSAQENAVNIQQRVDGNREKQELEYSKARETIKYLRDENTKLSAKLEQQVSELEDKLREYRLRFEYAQKQLNNN